nr:MAG TPA: hypothetical protein [Caudoviricetes sp.]
MVSTKLLTYILYHLQAAIASGTHVLCQLLFLYPFLCDVAHILRKVI